MTPHYGQLVYISRATKSMTLRSGARGDAKRQPIGRIARFESGKSDVVFFGNLTTANGVRAGQVVANGVTIK